jgi:hypothetical protein
MAVQHLGLGKAITGLCVGVAFVLAAALWPAPAAAQRTELRPLLDRLDRIERELNLLQRQVYRGRAAPAPAGEAREAATPGLSPSVAARMEVRISELDSELRNITGRVEETSFALDQLETRLEKLVGDVDVRLSALEQSVATAGMARAPAGAPEGGPGEALAAEGAVPAEAGPVPGPAPIGEYGVRYFPPTRRRSNTITPSRCFAKPITRPPRRRSRPSSEPTPTTNSWRTPSIGSAKPIMCARTMPTRR